MPMPRNDAKAKLLYTDYASGLSLAEVAGKHDMSRQAVHRIFTRRGWVLRTTQPLPFVVFNGAKYTLRNTGYYGRTDGKRALLHRDVWEFYHGPIPDGWDVHHKDEEKSNNAPDNLECLPKPEHTRLYSPHNNQYTKGRKR